jgi:predicted ATPase/DNA-binding phage protein
MKILNLKVENFRGVQKVELTDLKDLVVIAGQNGSGKSCLLEAIKFLKSVYGGYQPNEIHQWFGEFQINFTNDPRALARIFNDPNKHLVLEFQIELHQSEKMYLTEHAERLITQQAWSAAVPELGSWLNIDVAPLTSQHRVHEAKVRSQLASDMKLFRTEIRSDVYKGQITIEPDKMPTFHPSKVLELAFSQYAPESIGIVDYHGAHRQFGREQINSININLDAIEEQRRQSALYNYNTKYSNVKSEMAGLYVREALAQRAGVKTSGSDKITETLRELFTTFFPDKEFLGPLPNADGSLRFPVKVGGRETHDLDELSSGEKEILYGYLRLRSSTPRNSVVLLDEPELHLNPRLTRNLPQFYHKHLSQELGHQVWLVTHSDTILRSSVGRESASVFHLTPSAYFDGKNQARIVKVDQDLERAIIELVGDLAAYNPGAKVAIFEGEDSEFDVVMTSALFPELPATVNLISGTNKIRVRSLHNLLERIQGTGKVPPMQVYSIVDMDAEAAPVKAASQLTWDRYHIENYLLEPHFIQKAMEDILDSRDVLTAAQIEKALLVCARSTISAQVVHRIGIEANREIVDAIKTRIAPQSRSIAKDLVQVIANSHERIAKLRAGPLSEVELQRRVKAIEIDFKKGFKSEKWKRVVRGRDVLRQFVKSHVRSVAYEPFRNLILARMRDEGYRPKGMVLTLKPILDATSQMSVRRI